MEISSARLETSSTFQECYEISYTSTPTNSISPPSPQTYSASPTPSKRTLTGPRFSHLSPEVIGSALGSDSLKHARSISLCIDHINGTPAELVSALATHTPPLDSLYLHQAPTRQTDQPTADLLAHLITHPQLARTPSLFLTGIFSTSLRRTILLPPHTFTPHSPPLPHSTSVHQVHRRTQQR